MVGAILGIIDSVLGLIVLKKRREYQDEHNRLLRAYREEWNKDPALRSDAVLDNIEFEVKILAKAIENDLRLAGAK